MTRGVRLAASIIVVAVAGGAAGASCPRGAVRPRGGTPPVFYQLPPRATCDTSYLPTEVAGLVGNPELLEASGLAPSAKNAEVLWSVNDSGSDALVYALGEDGSHLGAVRLPVANEDFEDVAVAPCPDLVDSCVYVADTGDNALARSSVVVYAFAEPPVSPEEPLSTADGPVSLAAEALWRFPLRFPDGPVNVEALVVVPDATAMLLFEKTTDESARIYVLQAPWFPEQPTTLEQRGVVSLPPIGGDTRITGASIHWTGRLLAIRTYEGVYEFTLQSLSELFDLDARTPWVAVVPEDEAQGESVCYGGDGTSLFTLSESDGGSSGVALHVSECAPTS